MIELRWVTSGKTTTEPPKLQYRVRFPHERQWSKWKDVPLVVVPDRVVKS